MRNGPKARAAHLSFEFVSDLNQFAKPNLNNLFPGEELIVIPPASGEDLQKPIPLGQSIGLSVLLFILAILLSFLSTFLFSGN